MKYLKWPLIILVGIIAIYALLCLVGPKNMNTTKSTVIEAPAAVVYNLVNNLKNVEKWSPWVAMDTSMVITYGDKVEGIGGKSKWVGDPKQSGTGSQEIIASTKNESVKTKLLFEGWDAVSYSDWTFIREGNSTNTTWSMTDEKDLPFLLRGMMLLQGMKGKLANNFDDGLASLKKFAEGRAGGTYDGYKIKVMDKPERHFVMNRQVVDFANIKQFYTTNLGGLFGKVQKHGAEMDGMPCGLFFKYNVAAGNTDMAAAIPVKEPIAIKDVLSYTSPESKALEIDYYGDYNGTGAAHDALDAYMKDNGLFSNPPAIEEYVTDPGTQPDPSKWLTRVTYFIAE